MKSPKVKLRNLDYYNKRIAKDRLRDWDLGNKILYDLCRRNSAHTKPEAIVAKIWLIGRAYSASIERRKTKNKKKINNDRFYTKTVVSEILDSKIDLWFDNIRHYKKANDNNLLSLLETHAKVVGVFEGISDMKKRSLASKYLHFHFPNLFFIYDARAVKGLRKICKGQVGIPQNENIDEEYAKFFRRCLAVQKKIKEDGGGVWRPRKIDDLLLSVAK